MIPLRRSFRRSAGFCLLNTLLAVALAAAAEPPKVPGVDLTAMNPAVVPGDDFWQYSNGAWIAKTEIPADRGNWGAGSALGEETNKRIIALIKAAAKNPAATAPERIAAGFYGAYMDEATIETRGLAAVQPLLQRIAGLTDKTALARYLGEGLRADVDPINATNFYTENLFGLWVAQGFDDPTHYHAYLLQGGLGLTDCAYYLTKNAHMDDIRAKYLAHIATVMRLSGFSEPEARAARVYELEHKIAAVHTSREDSEDVLKANNVWSRADLVAKAPGLDWSAYLAAAGLDGQKDLIAWHAGAVVGEAALVGSEPLATWQDFLAYHTLNHFSGVLPAAFVQEKFAFYETTMRGTPQQQARWKRALAAANAVVGDAVGQVYVAKYFPASSKARLQAMVANIVAAFDARIGRLDWMAPATKEQARAKLKTLYVGVGYPDKWDDYAGLVLDPRDALGNQLRAEQYGVRRAVAKLGGPVDATAWCMSPQEVNAVNMPMQNALNFPAAILQPPYFDPAAADAVNYGAVGAVIGHEISHSFDDQGAQFDAQGRLRDWWTPADRAHFQAATAALVAQYNTYKPFTDLAVNGQLTISENLADLGGLNAAYDAYRMASGGSADLDRAFFIAFAQSWRSKMRDATLRQRILTDGHAPAQYRTLTVRNLDAWYAAFDVQPGQALYLDPGARVRVW